MNLGMKRILDIARVSDSKTDQPKSELATVEQEDESEE